MDDWLDQVPIHWVASVWVALLLGSAIAWQSRDATPEPQGVGIVGTTAADRG